MYLKGGQRADVIADNGEKFKARTTPAFIVPGTGCRDAHVVKQFFFILPDPSSLQQILRWLFRAVAGGAHVCIFEICVVGMTLDRPERPSRRHVAERFHRL